MLCSEHHDHEWICRMNTNIKVTPQVNEPYQPIV